MKKLLFVVTLFVCATSKAQKIIHQLPIDEATGKVCYSEIFNVYNREAPNVFKYAIEYFKKEHISYVVDSSNMSVRGRVNFKFKGFKRACIATVDTYPEMIVYAKDGKSKIDFTNITYKSEGACTKEGDIEQLITCDCALMPDFKTWIFDKMALQARDYHQHLKEATRTSRDW